MKTETASGEPLASRLWLERLGGSGHEREGAVVELHALLLKAARFEVNRRRRALPHLRGEDYEDLAQQSADDALMAVLRKLKDFRGESRFTTWAYKFALLEAAVNVRRRAWQGHEIPLEEEGWAVLADAAVSVQHRVEQAELIEALREEIARGLSDHQREVLVAVTLNDVPIDILAERLGSTRGAVYKTLHDARRKLRSALAERGLRAGAGGEEMNEPKIPRSPAKVIARVLGPDEPELSCEECFAELDRYVELDLAGSDPDRHVPGMHAHLEGCPACEEDFRSLKALLESQ